MQKDKIKVNRTHKDKLFRLIFNNKKDLLQLYNAVSGTEYTNEEDLIINTLEDAVYIGMKNDLSFLIKGTLNLYEHQSTINPNIPLRGLIYFADVIQGFIELGKYNIFGSSRIMLPVPKFIVFYNGTADQPDRMEMCLSESFLPHDQEACLECKAIVLNVNWGHNKELMEKCRRLSDYAAFIAEIRKRNKGNVSLEQAVSDAADYCIHNGILDDILRKNRGEVLNVILTEYDEERHIAFEKDLSRKEGMELMSKLTKLLLKNNRQEDLQLAFEDEEYRDILLREYNLLNTDTI